MVTRLDLDGTSSPMGLVGKILKAEPSLKIPVPIEDIARQLDIVEIGELKTDGFEGCLLTNDVRSTGGILVKAGASRHRRRFTIGHELGHFLIPFHKPSEPGKFLCDNSALHEWDSKSKNRSIKMEVEANQFSALLLMPPPYLRPILNGKRFATLDTILEIHEHFDVSKEAAARAYSEYNPERVAVLVVKDGRFLRAYRQSSFPWIFLKSGDPVPEVSSLHRSSLRMGVNASEPTQAEHWIETEWGKQIPPMYEQILLQENGFAMIQLKMHKDKEEDFDPEENMTSKERLRHRQSRWQP